MKLTKEKAVLLLQKLMEFCVWKGIIKIPKSQSLRYYEAAGIIMRRYGSIVLVDSDNTKYLCNNVKYFKKWALGESLHNAGSPLKLSLCGEFNKKLKKEKQHG